jgi:hypothetical protein
MTTAILFALVLLQWIAYGSLRKRLEGVQWTLEGLRVRVMELEKRRDFE